MPRPGEAPTNLPPAVANLGLGTLSQALGPESLGYYTGPHAYEALKNAGTVAGYLTPSFGKEQAVAAGTEAERGNYGKAAALGGLGLAGAAADMIPGEALVKAGVKGATKLPNVLDLVKDYLPTTGAAAILPARVGGMGGLGGAPIKAYHGSPHDFDAFDLSKIGTGEGAQAYGHGLYFAENPDVARGYRDTLSRRSGGGDENMKIGGRPVLDLYETSRWPLSKPTRRPVRGWRSCRWFDKSGSSMAACTRSRSTPTRSGFWIGISR
jgi:hypothetical protein